MCAAEGTEMVFIRKEGWNLEHLGPILSAINHTDRRQETLCRDEAVREGGKGVGWEKINKLVVIKTKKNDLKDVYTFAQTWLQ